jgi:cytochrome c556
MRTLVALLLAGSAVAQAPPNKPQPYENLKHENLKQVMRSVPLPNSDIIFGVQSKLPRNDMEWQTVENAAIAIEETANLILLPGRMQSNGKPVPVQAADFVKYARALGPAGRDCLKAAQKKSQDLISYCTDGLSQACDNCHNAYRDKT